MHPMLNIAVKAARAAGDIISRNVDRIDTLTIENKARNDWVSDVDRMAEDAIIRVIKRAFPQHGILAEESGNQNGNEYLWIIDPLDGTTNFLHGFPQYAVSIALQNRDTIEQAVVYDPYKQELFTASKGNGAALNGRRIRVTSLRSLDGALLGTGIPFREDQDLDLYLKTMKAVLPGTAGVRRAGSAALDLAYVAAGRMDGFWEFNLHPWDMAAGILLIREAGGIVSDSNGQANYMKNGNIIAGGLKVHSAMLKAIKPVLQSS
jgi:myo-inositol-1(or 4)-monophosphatase